MRLIKKTFLIIIFLLLNCAVIYSQTIQVEKISIPEGLSNTTIKRIFQDSYGLIWIPTEDGLNVYDGYKIKIYKNIPGNPKSIVDNSVWSVSEDKERNIWIATEAGVYQNISILKISLSIMRLKILSQIQTSL
jgi:ligand-binding sensor domain-containing protein